jgi:hypothetical protein
MGKPNFGLGGDSSTLPGGFFSVVTNTSRYIDTQHIVSHLLMMIPHVTAKLPLD